MNKDTELYRILWTQTYKLWDEFITTRENDPEITDFTEAQEVLARIMAK